MPSHSSITVPGFGEVPVVALGTIDGSFGTTGFGSDDEEPIFLSPLQRRLRERGGLFGFGGGTLGMLSSLAFRGFGAGLSLRPLRPMSGSATASGRNAAANNSSRANNNNNSDSNSVGGTGSGDAGNTGSLLQSRALGLLDLHNRVTSLVRAQTLGRTSLTSNRYNPTADPAAQVDSDQDIPSLSSDVDADDGGHGASDDDENGDYGDDDDGDGDDDDALDYMEVDDEYGEFFDDDDDFDMDVRDAEFNGESLDRTVARSLDSGDSVWGVMTEREWSSGADENASSHASGHTPRPASCGSDQPSSSGRHLVDDLGLSEEEEPLLAAHRAAQVGTLQPRPPRGEVRISRSSASCDASPGGLEARAGIGSAGIDATTYNAAPPLHTASEATALCGAEPGPAPGRRRHLCGTLTLAWSAARFAWSAMIAPLRFVLFVAGLSSNAVAAMARSHRVQAEHSPQVTFVATAADGATPAQSHIPAAGPGTYAASAAGAQYRQAQQPTHGGHAGQERGRNVNERFERPPGSAVDFLRNRAHIGSEAEGAVAEGTLTRCPPAADYNATRNLTVAAYSISASGASEILPLSFDHDPGTATEDHPFHPSLHRNVAGSDLAVRFATPGTDVSLWGNWCNQGHTSANSVDSILALETEIQPATMPASTANEHSRNAAGPRRRMAWPNSRYSESPAGGTSAARRWISAPRNSCDRGSEADEESFGSGSDLDSDFDAGLRRFWPRQLLDADLEQLLSLAAFRSPSSENLQGPPGANQAVVSSVGWARASAARGQISVHGETGTCARSWAHRVEGLSPLYGRPRPFGTPRALLRVSSLLRGAERPFPGRRQDYPGGRQSPETQMLAAAGGSGTGARGADLQLASRSGVAAAGTAGAPFLLRARRYGYPEANERLQRLLLRHAASMENLRHPVPTTSPSAAAAEEELPGVCTSTRQSMMSPELSGRYVPTATCTPRSVPFAPWLLQLPDTELSVSVLNVLSANELRRGPRGDSLMAAGTSGGDAGAQPSRTSAAGAAMAVIPSSASPGSELWTLTNSAEERQRWLRAMESLTGNLPAINAMALRPAHQVGGEDRFFQNVGALRRSIQATSEDGRRARSRLLQLGGAGQIGNRRRPLHRQQRSGRQAWEDRVNGGVGDSNNSLDSSSGPWRYYYSDGVTDYQALVDRTRRLMEGSLADLCLPRFGNVSNGRASGWLGAWHGGTAAVPTTGTVETLGVGDTAWGYLRAGVPRRMFRVPSASLAVDRTHSSLLPWPGAASLVVGGEGSGDRSVSTLSMSSDRPNLTSDVESSPRAEQCAVLRTDRERLPGNYWRQRLHELVQRESQGWQHHSDVLDLLNADSGNNSSLSELMTHHARAAHFSYGQESVPRNTRISFASQSAREGLAAVAAVASSPRPVADIATRVCLENRCSGWQGTSSNTMEVSAATECRRPLASRGLVLAEASSDEETCYNYNSDLEEIAARLSVHSASIVPEVPETESNVPASNGQPQQMLPTAEGETAGESVRAERSMSTTRIESNLPESGTEFADVTDADYWEQGLPELVLDGESHHPARHRLPNLRNGLHQRFLDASRSADSSRSLMAGLPLHSNEGGTALASESSSGDSSPPNYWCNSPREQQFDDQPSAIGGRKPACSGKARTAAGEGMTEDDSGIGMSLSSSVAGDMMSSVAAGTARVSRGDYDLLPPLLNGDEGVQETESEKETIDDEWLPPLVGSVEEGEETSRCDVSIEEHESPPTLIDEETSTTNTYDADDNGRVGGSHVSSGFQMASNFDGESQEFWADDAFERYDGNGAHTLSRGSARQQVPGIRTLGRGILSETDSDVETQDLISSGELEPIFSSMADLDQTEGAACGTVAGSASSAASGAIRLGQSIGAQSRGRRGPPAASVIRAQRQELYPQARRSSIMAAAARFRSSSGHGVGLSGGDIVNFLGVYRRMAEERQVDGRAGSLGDQFGSVADSDASSDSMPPLVSLEDLRCDSAGSGGVPPPIENEVNESRTGNPAVVRRRLAWAEYRGFPSAQRQQDTPSVLTTTTSGTASAPQPDQMEFAFPAVPMAGSGHTTVADDTEEQSGRGAEPTWRIAVEALMRVLLDIRAGGNANGGGASVASRALTSLPGLATQFPTASSGNDLLRPRATAAGSGGSGGSSNNNNNRSGVTSQIVASLVRIPADVLSNVPPGSVLSITIPTGGLTGTVTGDSGSGSGDNGGSDGTRNRVGASNTAARILPLQLGALSSFPMSWRSYLPPDDTSGRHPNDYPGLPGTYEMEDIPAWAARFAPLAPESTQGEVTGSGSGRADTATAAAGIPTEQAGADGDATLTAGDSNAQTSAMPVRWQNLWEDFSFSFSTSGAEAANNDEASEDDEVSIHHIAGDSEGHQSDTESLPDSLPDLVPLEANLGTVASSSVATQLGVEDHALESVTTAGASGRAVTSPPPNAVLGHCSVAGEGDSETGFPDGIGTEIPIRREGNDGGDNSIDGTGSRDTDSQASRLDDSRAEAHYPHSAAAHVPHELEDMQDGVRDRSQALTGVCEVRERVAAVGAPADINDSGNGSDEDSDASIPSVLRSLLHLPLPPAFGQQQEQVQHADLSQLQLREHNGGGHNLEAEVEAASSGAGATTAMVMRGHEVPESRHIRSGSATAPVPLPPMPDGAGAAPPQHSPIASTRGVNTVSRYAGLGMEETYAEPQMAQASTAGSFEHALGAGSGAQNRAAEGAAVPITRAPGTVPARRNAVTYPRSVLLSMLEALQNSEPTFNSAVHVGSRGSTPASVASPVVSASVVAVGGTVATTTTLGLTLGWSEGAPRSDGHVATAAALLRDSAFVAQVLDGLEGVATEPPTSCVLETVRMLQSTAEMHMLA